MGAPAQTLASAKRAGDLGACGAPAAIFMCVEIALAAWLFSGSSAEYAFPMFAAAVLCYAFCAFARGGPGPGLERVVNAALVLLCVVCAVQYFNPMSENVVCERYSYLKNIDFIKWLPASVKAEYYSGNAFSSLVNISTALCVFAAALRLFGDGRRRVALLAWLAINAVLMGAVACAQKYLKTPIIYGFHYTTADFFGSFPLSNAAGAFMNLAVAVCVYLAFECRGGGFKRILGAAFWLCAAAFLSFAAWLSESKGAMLANALFWAGFALMCAAKLSAFLARRTSALFIAAAWCGIIAIAAFALPEAQIKAEAEKIAETKTVKVSAASRLEIYKAAYALVKERPYFGHGGGSCAYVLPREMMKNRDTAAAKNPAIAINAHSDILEYAIDYGALGLFAIFAILAAWVYYFIKCGRAFGRAVLFMAAALCMAHSCIDIHLHIPATMVVLAIVMAAAAVKQNGGRAQ